MATLFSGIRGCDSYVFVSAVSADLSFTEIQLNGKEKKSVPTVRSGSSFSAWLAEDGYSGVEVRVTPTRTEFIIMASAPRTCSARSDHRIRELNAVIYGVLRFIMESCAKGYEVVVSGKLRGQRAKSMTFVDGMMIHSDDPCKEATPLRQGELGIQVKIVLPWDPNGNIGPKEPLSDNVEMVEPKDEIMYNTPRSEPKNKPSALKLGAGRTVEVVEFVIS